MTDKIFDREALKRACLAALDEVAVEHGAGHQGKLAARYVLQDRRGAAIELMFEKGPKTPAHLWMPLEAGEPLIDEGIPYRLSPAAETYAAKDANDRPLYGRHSALKPMRQLANSDLIRFTIDRPGQIDRLLQRLRESGKRCPDHTVTA